MHEIPYEVMPSLLFCHQVGLYAEAYIDLVYGPAFKAIDLEFMPSKRKYLEFMPVPPSIESLSLNTIRAYPATTTTPSLSSAL